MGLFHSSRWRVSKMYGKRRKITYGVLTAVILVIGIVLIFSHGLKFFATGGPTTINQAIVDYQDSQLRTREITSQPVVVTINQQSLPLAVTSTDPASAIVGPDAAGTTKTFKISLNGTTQKVNWMKISPPQSGGQAPVYEVLTACNNLLSCPVTLQTSFVTIDVMAFGNGQVEFAWNWSASQGPTPPSAITLGGNASPTGLVAGQAIGATFEATVTNGVPLQSCNWTLDTTSVSTDCKLTNGKAIYLMATAPDQGNHTLKLHATATTGGQNISGDFNWTFNVTAAPAFALYPISPTSTVFSTTSYGVSTTTVIVGAKGGLTSGTITSSQGVFGKCQPISGTLSCDLNGPTSIPRDGQPHNLTATVNGTGTGGTASLTYTWTLTLKNGSASHSTSSETLSSQSASIASPQVVGIVTDSSNQAVIDATVAVYDGKTAVASTTTDPTGNYAVTSDKITAGKNYTVEVTKGNDYAARATVSPTATASQNTNFTVNKFNFFTRTWYKVKIFFSNLFHR